MPRVMAVTHGIGTQVNMLILLNVFGIKKKRMLFIYQTSHSFPTYIPE